METNEPIECKGRGRGVRPPSPWDGRKINNSGVWPLCGCGLWLKLLAETPAPLLDVQMKFFAFALEAGCLLERARR